MTNSRLITDWTDPQSEKLGNDILIAEHRLAETGLFGEESLASLLDKHPRKDLGVSSMGTDPCKPGDWNDGDAGSLSGAELIQAVGKGHLWLNLRRAVDNHPELAKVVNQLYDELQENCPGFHAFHRSANLLISAPTAIVYYHMDCPLNMLWHITGTKRVWVYPTDERFLPKQTVEDVLAGTSSEEIYFDPAFDDSAFVADLEPGQMITWALHSPHRVVNTGGVNVSLSTEHYTKRALRKNNVYLANRHFRNWHASFGKSSKTEGFGAAFKEAALRLARRIPPLAPEAPSGYVYEKKFVVDLDAPNCIRWNNDAAAVPRPVVDLAPPIGTTSDTTV